MSSDYVPHDEHNELPEIHLADGLFPEMPDELKGEISREFSDQTGKEIEVRSDNGDKSGTQPPPIDDDIPF